MFQPHICLSLKILRSFISKRQGNLPQLSRSSAKLWTQWSCNYRLHLDSRPTWLKREKLQFFWPFQLPTSNHWIPNKFEFPQSPAPSPSVVHSLPWTNGSNRSCQRMSNNPNPKRNKRGEKFSWWTAWGFQTAASSAAELKPPTLRKKKGHPEENQNHEQMKVFSPKNMGHNP